MIIQCDKCSTRFRLDDTRITPNGVKVRCTKCDNVFIVTPPPPPEEVAVEELFGVAPGQQAPEPAAAGGPQPKGQPSSSADDRHLSFDFNDGVTKEDPFREPERPAEDKEAGKKDFSFDDLDFSFSSGPSEKEDDGAGGPGSEDEPGDAGAKAAAGPETRTDEGPGDFGFDPGGEPEKDDKDGFDFGFDDLGDETPARDEAAASGDETMPEAGPETEPETVAAGPAEAAGPEQDASAQNVIPFQAAAYAKAAGAPSAGAGTPSAQDRPVADDEADEPFRAVLSRTIDEEETVSFGPVGRGDDTADDEPLDEEEVDFEEAPSRAPSRMGLVVAALVIILGGGIIYFTGVIDRLTGMLMPPASSQLKGVEIEAIKGFYEENRNFGRVFVIAALVRNITDEPQEIKAATGIIYDKGGDRIAERSVSPGRIVSADDLKNLGREDLDRAFRDPSGGVIPARGSVPVMVLFTDSPDGVSEFGLDIVK